MEITDSDKQITKKSKKLKYIHRTIYVFLVLLGVNLIWDIFATAHKSPKHFILGITVIIGFSLFYFIVKNIKRYFIKKNNIKSKFFDSTTFVPFVYLCSSFLFMIIVNFSSFFLDSGSSTSTEKIANNVSTTEVSGKKNKDYDNVFENDFKNLVFFFNISMCKYAVYPLSAEHPELIKKFYKENIIDKKWVASTKMILISFLCSFLMQVFATNIAEKIIYKSVRKKQKKSPRNKNKILIQPI